MRFRPCLVENSQTLDVSIAMGECGRINRTLNTARKIMLNTYLTKIQRIVVAGIISKVSTRCPSSP